MIPGWMGRIGYECEPHEDPDKHNETHTDPSIIDKPDNHTEPVDKPENHTKPEDHTNPDDGEKPDDGDHTKPIDNTTKPENHTKPEQPDDSTSKPDDHTTKPDNHTTPDTEPEKNITKPDNQTTEPVDPTKDNKTDPIVVPPVKKNDTEVAVFAMGCFWCGEAAMAQVPGVISVKPGYTGGRRRHPTYEQVCAGGTGHLESVEVVFNNTIIPYKKLLYYFWRNVDPTNGVGQFCDHGKQYLSAIFYTSAEQADAAFESFDDLQ